MHRQNTTTCWSRGPLFTFNLILNFCDKNKVKSQPSDIGSEDSFFLVSKIYHGFSLGLAGNGIKIAYDCRVWFAHASGQIKGNINISM